MKKAWIKFKHWLIEKLGGHVTLPIKPKIEYFYAHPETLVVRKDLDLSFFQNDMVYADMVVKRALAEELAKNLIENNLLEITTTDDVVYWKRRYEARIVFYDRKGGAE